MLLNGITTGLKDTHRLTDNMYPLLVKSDIISQMSKSSDEDLTKLAAVNRINCLAGLRAANHGWLGACFSCMEILTVIYNRFLDDPLKPIAERGSVHLSKGHAAMALYAVLASKNCFETERLYSYKKDGGLAAHCDSSIVGVDSDSGSLGQGLSKAIGCALSNRSHGNMSNVFAIIGDGELQEGQVFESLLTLKRYDLGNCIPIIDRNYLQSDSRTSEIKDAESWPDVFKGVGLNVVEVDGHDIAQLTASIESVSQRQAPSIIIAHTYKGGGTSVTEMSRETPRRQGVWHGKIPDDDQYLKILDELVGKTENQQLFEFLQEYKKFFVVNSSVDDEKPVSTGQEFASAILDLAREDKQIMVLDADLEKPCRLEEVAKTFADRFVEVGISEQDMCSIASGIALTGKIPIVNTYAAFYKRSIDQIFAASAEKLPVIFAAHYSGTDYFTDGKSHQSVNDIGLIRAIGGIEILEPVSPAATREIISYVLKRMKKQIFECKPSFPAYIRLHRTGISDIFEQRFEPFRPVEIFTTAQNEQKNLLFTHGPHNAQAAVYAAQLLAKEGVFIDVWLVSHFDDSKKIIKKLVEQAHRTFAYEDHCRNTGLGAFIASTGFVNPVRIGVSKLAGSAESLQKMRINHDLEPHTICAVVKKVLCCEHKQRS